MSTDITNTVDTYLATWNETDPAKRAELIDASLAADLWYRDPMLEADGLEAYDGMIAAVQAQFPGLVMRRTSPVDAHRDLVRFNWALGERGRRSGVRRPRRRQVRRRRQAAPHHRLRRRDDRRGLASMSVSSATATVGAMLRDWRADRRRSQLDLALDVGVSTRHLSFVETGKAKPSPELVLALAEHLEVPLRERNTMLLGRRLRAARTRRRRSTARRWPASARRWPACCDAHDPYPAVVVDRAWDVVMTNQGAQGLLGRRRRAPAAAAAELVPHHAAPRRYGAAHRELRRVGPPPPRHARAAGRGDTGSPPGRPPRGGGGVSRTSPSSTPSWRTRDATPTVVVPLRLRVGDGDEAVVQSWFSTNTSFGTPVDITLDELHVELFHPADEATAAIVGGRLGQ